MKDSSLSIHAAWLLDGTQESLCDDVLVDLGLSFAVAKATMQKHEIIIGSPLQRQRQDMRVTLFSFSFGFRL